ncbi:pentapeptide repeat-containing protein [Pseudomonas sp. SL4(2022)]|uniref:pentapeptide repeat-containing protein n=1 Tax=Pseudomonas sp. SL4(2022) TaxID=2994661 RepID=UPI00226E965B|nr:pentapeptide repeat-containing protein [Pseudomonas sp. SL4(2022)]WAC45073.1 pentapeptide repeat-containing protein [Pseudomonas sp. SL4(2022)]
MSQPKQLDNPLYALIHNEKVSAFNAQKPKDTVVDLSDGDFRGLDLRALDAHGINFTNAYFRGADLRGLDLRYSQLEGASIAHAQISGAYFPVELTADEILMSVNFGTRLRYKTR